MSPVEDRILYEDNHLIVVDKMCGELSQGDDTGDRTLADAVKAYLKSKYSKPGNVYLGIPHRLDRPTSGVMVYARTEKALVRLNEAFRTDDVSKTYWAIVDRLPPKDSDTLTHYIVRDSQANKSTAYMKEVKGSKKAVLKYTLLASSELHIKGDLKYGFPRSNPDGGICLHARRIEFTHPVRKERLTIVAPPPRDALWDWFVSRVEG